jgi:putative SOS response-associated peptidase YedK
MCGRFALFAPGQDIGGQFGVEINIEIAPRYNIAPTQPVAAVRLDDHSGERELTHFQWGLIPSWAKDPKIGSRMINARSETVAEKPSFRAAFKRRRCLIPASGFYEWQKLGDRKQPTFVQGSEDQLLGLAGLWEIWHDADGGVIESCTILTTQPNELIAPIHNRMPVIVAPEDYSMWLDPGQQPEDGLHLLRPYDSELMKAYPVSTAVNNPRNDSPGCIEPLA